MERSDAQLGFIAFKVGWSELARHTPTALLSNLEKFLTADPLSLAQVMINHVITPHVLFL